ncbi:hypothetical protein B566_EDAN006281, partial [Ephemera danica]
FPGQSTSEGHQYQHISCKGSSSLVTKQVPRQDFAVIPLIQHETLLIHNLSDTVKLEPLDLASENTEGFDGIVAQGEHIDIKDEPFDQLIVINETIVNNESFEKNVVAEGRFVEMIVKEDAFLIDNNEPLDHQIILTEEPFGETVDDVTEEQFDESVFNKESSNETVVKSELFENTVIKSEVQKAETCTVP